MALFIYQIQVRAETEKLGWLQMQNRKVMTDGKRDIRAKYWNGLKTI